MVPNPGRTISVLALGQCHLDLPKFIDEKMTKLKKGFVHCVLFNVLLVIETSISLFLFSLPLLVSYYKFMFKKLLLR